MTFDGLVSALRQLGIAVVMDDDGHADITLTDGIAWVGVDGYVGLDLNTVYPPDWPALDLLRQFAMAQPEFATWEERLRRDW